MPVRIAWLQRNVELISLAEVQRRIGGAGNSRPCACITFDDGYAENCRQAIPLLIREKIPCTYFVTLQNILTGESFPHDRAAGRHFPPNKLDELRVMADAGIEIGSHSYTHLDLSQVSDPAILYREVVVAAEELRDRLQCPVRRFAVPYGQPRQLKPVVFDLARQAGCEAVCSAYGGYNFPGDDPFHLRRIHGDGDLILLKNRATLDPRKLSRTAAVRTFPLCLREMAGERGPTAPGSSAAGRLPVGNALRGVSEASDEAFCSPRNATEGVPYRGGLLTDLPPGPPGDLPKARAATLRTDTLADSVLILLLLMVVQRLIGFCRAVLFCRWLDPGSWDSGT